MVKSIAKGHAWERQVAKVLSEWSGIQLRRTPLSGGWTDNTKGDIIPEVVGEFSKFPFCVECKHIKSLSKIGIWQFLAGKSKTLASFLEQTIKEGKLTGKIPMLVAKANFQSPMVFLPLHHIPDFVLEDRDCSKYPIGILMFKQEVFIVMALEALIQINFANLTRDIL